MSQVSEEERSIFDERFMKNERMCANYFSLRQLQT